MRARSGPGSWRCWTALALAAAACAVCRLQVERQPGRRWKRGQRRHGREHRRHHRWNLGRHRRRRHDPGCPRRGWHRGGHHPRQSHRRAGQPARWSCTGRSCPPPRHWPPPPPPWPATAPAHRWSSDRPPPATPGPGPSQRWQEAELHQYGPLGLQTTSAGGKDLRDQIYAWPFGARCFIEQELVSPALQAAELRQPGAAQRARAGHARVPAVLSGHRQRVRPRGRPSTPAAAGRRWRPTPDELARRKRQYAAAVAADVARRARELVDAWDPGQGQLPGPGEHRRRGRHRLSQQPGRAERPGLRAVVPGQQPPRT